MEKVFIMADEFEDYVFESKREISNDFALANGDVTSVLNGFRFRGTASVPLKKRSFVWSGATAGNAGIPAGGFSVPGLQGKSSVLSFLSRNNIFSAPGFSFDAGKTASFSSLPDISASSVRNTSNGEDLTLKAQETPVFSGLFANRDGGSAGNGKMEK